MMKKSLISIPASQNLKTIFLKEVQASQQYLSHQDNNLHRKLKSPTTTMEKYVNIDINKFHNWRSTMNYKIETMEAFKVIGYEREFSMDSSYGEIPKFWQEFNQEWEQATEEIKQAICDNKIGEYGVCIDDLGTNEKFRYFIAGQYHGGTIPEGMKLYEFPKSDWIKFTCTGPMPNALQELNTKVFSEWLPTQTEYELSVPANVEWYSWGDMTSSEYESGIWLPVKARN